MSGFECVTAESPLLLVGCGKMGGALLRGWLDCGLAASVVWIVEPGNANLDGLDDRPAICPAVVREASALPAGLHPSVVVLAVKPQAMDEALKPLARYAGPDSVFLSIAAGKTIDYFEQRLGRAAAVIRTMPNTPAAIGQGMTVAVANQHATPAQKALCEALMTAVGRFSWIDDEALMDVVTAVSGSGPAYVFYLAECLTAAAKTAGLSDDLARLLAVETVTGAGALMASSGEPPAQLRRNVTSPKGTTEAALDILMAKDGMASLMRKAVTAAAKRSRELSE